MQNLSLDSEMTLDEVDSNVKYAGFWIRVGASLLDLLAYSPVLLLYFYNLMAFKSLGLQLLVFLFLFLYKPFMEYRYGATLGKMAVGIKVIGIDYRPISLQQATLRYVPWMFSQAVSVYVIVELFRHHTFPYSTTFAEIAYLQNKVTPTFWNSIASLINLGACITVAFTTEKQGLHDLLAKTFCVYKKKG